MAHHSGHYQRAVRPVVRPGFTAAMTPDQLLDHARRSVRYFDPPRIAGSRWPINQWWRRCTEALSG